MHGGKATETHAGNQNARKHGIYSSVLTQEEKDLWDEVELGRVDEELRLCRLRLMRTIRAETAANDQPELDAISEEPMVVNGIAIPEEPITKRQLKRRDYAGLVDRLLGRIESLERTRAELLKQVTPPPDKDALAAAIIEQMNAAQAVADGSG